MAKTERFEAGERSQQAQGTGGAVSALKDAASSRKWRMRSSVEGWLDRYPPCEDAAWDSANFSRASASNAGDIALWTNSAAPKSSACRSRSCEYLACTRAAGA